jgi:hypothetical protein
MPWNEVQRYCHDHFEEWQNPGKSCMPILFEEILKAARKPAAFVEDLQSLQQEKAMLRKVFA